MTLVSELIRDAYRESDLISINAAPTAAEQAEALRLLLRIKASVYGNEAGEKLEQLPVGAANIEAPAGFPDDWWVQNPDSFVPLNRRLICNLQQPTVLNLHPMPQPGSRLGAQDLSGNFSTYPLTLNANGRLIEGLTTLTITENNFRGSWFYRDDLGSWERVSETLLLGDNWPFPLEFDSLFVTMLAMRLNPRHSVLADPQSIEEYKRSLRQFRARYSQVIQTPSEQGLLRLSEVGQNYWYDDYLNGDATAAFNIGVPV